MMLVEERSGGKRCRGPSYLVEDYLPAYRAIAGQHLPLQRDDAFPNLPTTCDARFALLGCISLALRKNSNNVILLL